MIGGYWDRKGEFEIDLVALNEIDKRAEIFEVKRKSENIDLEKLKETGYHFKRATGQLKDFKVTLSGAAAPRTTCCPSRPAEQGGERIPNR